MYRSADTAFFPVNCLYRLLFKKLKNSVANFSGGCLGWYNSNHSRCVRAGIQNLSQHCCGNSFANCTGSTRRKDCRSGRTNQLRSLKDGELRSLFLSFHSCFSSLSLLITFYSVLSFCPFSFNPININ